MITERTKSQVQAAGTGVLHRVAGISLGEERNVQSSGRDSLEPLLLKGVSSGREVEGIKN